MKAFEHLLLKIYLERRWVTCERAASAAQGALRRARVDWGADHRVPAQRAAGQSLLRWLFASDAAGNEDAMFRRLGLMYVIWNKRIWGTWGHSGGRTRVPA